MELDAYGSHGPRCSLVLDVCRNYPKTSHSPVLSKQCNGVILTRQENHHQNIAVISNGTKKGDQI